MKSIENTLRGEGPRQYEEEARSAAQRLSATAADRGLLDVAYAHVDSPVGRLTLVRTPRGLAEVSYSLDDVVVPRFAQRLSPRALEAPAALDAERRQLDEYFAGRRTRFDFALDWSLTSGFSRRVLQRLWTGVGYGELTTYQRLAAAAGSPRAYRAAGNALNRNPLAIVVPCHRVLRSGGHLGGYAGGLPVKEQLLRLEGSRP